MVIAILFSAVLALWALPWLQEGGRDQSHASRDVALYSILDKAGFYASNYHKVCRDWVAEERMVQKEFDSEGKLKQQRRFVSDYFFVSLPSDPWEVVEVREIKTVDGKPIRRKGLGIRELLARKSSSATAEFEQLAAESNRYNLGRKRHSNLVNIGLTFLMPGHQDDIRYELTIVTIEGAEHSKTAILRFWEQTDRTTLHAATPHGKDPLFSSGEIWLMFPKASVLKVDFSFRQQQGKHYSLAGRYVSEYQPGPDGLLLPARFQEYLYDTTPVGYIFPVQNDPVNKKKSIEAPETKGITFESEAIYGNYRRFSAEVKLLPEEPSSEAEESKTK